MALDGIVIHALVHELSTALVGGRISKIHQPYATDIVLHVRSGGANYRLLISANHSHPRMYVTEESFTNPLEAPMFTMLLRKHIEGGIILAIKQIQLERIIHMDISSRDELGDLQTLTLVVELMGRHSNIILVNSEQKRILDGIHHVTPSISQYRQVMPGRAYIAPPEQGKLNPLNVDEQTFSDRIGDTTPNIEQLLVQHFQGISPLLAKEIAYRAHVTNQDLWHVFSHFMQSVKEHHYEPTITTKQKSVFSITPMRHMEGKYDRFNSISACMQAFYQKKAAADLIRQTAQDLLRKLNTERSKNKKKLEKLEQTLSDAHKSNHYRIWGELLTSYQHQIARGDKETTVLNYYEETEQMITIPLDPMYTAIENAQMYFKRYNKAKNSIAVVEEQIEKTKQEINYLEALIAQIEMADQNALNEIREELMEQGYIRKRKKQQKAKKNTSTTPKLERYISSEGFPIYVGKNNTQNDYLTNRFARNTDTWLHTKDIPGSHVVISGEGFGEQTLHEAANIAAFFSKGRQSSSVAVDYTYIRHVRKPNGAKPGYVIYDHQKTLYVTPDEEQIERLAKKV